MLRAQYCRYLLDFKEPATTSRSTMRDKETFFVKIFDEAEPSRFGFGECAVFRGLSAEDTPDYESELARICRSFDGRWHPSLFSSINFGFESALADMEYRAGVLPCDEFSVRINGLIWMGDRNAMYRRICDKLDKGFRCIKLKIGGINFDDEVELLRFIRSRFSYADLELRLDANGSFMPVDALRRLDILSAFSIHSVEQPIKPRQWNDMARIIKCSPVPVALDEELIGCWADGEREKLLDALKPHYIILKPSLCGGFESADRWITAASERGIGWWATSALESNVGLTAIARWLRKYSPVMPQGLGTGALYLNNTPSSLQTVGERLVVGSGSDLPSLKYIDELFTR